MREGSLYMEEFLFESEEDGTPISFSGRKARMQIKDKRDGSLLLSLSSDGVDPDPRIELEPDGETGSIRLIIGGTKTRLIGSHGVYDLETYNPDDPDEDQTELTGSVIVEPEITTEGS